MAEPTTNPAPADAQGNPIPPQVGQPGMDQPRPKPAAVPRTVELVSAGSIFSRMLRGFFALDSQVDDAERQYGPKLYESMMNDPAAGSCVDVIRQAAAREPQFLPPKEMRPAPGQVPTPEQAKAAEVCERVERAIRNPRRPLVETLYEFTYGLVEDKLAEIVLAAQAAGPDAGRFVVDRFKFKPREAWKYVVDAYGNVGFVAGRLPPGEQPPAPNEAAYVPGTGGNAILLEPDRFAVFSWGRRDSDPRCRPILRRAYNAWNLKVRTWPEKLKGDTQFGTPSLAAILPQDSEDPEPDSVASLKLPDGRTVETAEDLAIYYLVQLANGSAGVFPFGTILQVIESERDGAGLNESVRLYNNEIATAILHAPRTTQEAQHGSKADSEGASDVTSLLVSLVRVMLAGLLRNVARTLVRLNDGPEAAATMTPVVSLGDVEDADVAKIVTAFSQWVKVGAPTPSQMPAIDALLKLPPRLPGEPSLADVAAARALELREPPAPEDSPEDEEQDETAAGMPADKEKGET